MYVKICGLRDADIARHAVECGADAVGVVMSPKSPRHASEAEARKVVGAVRDLGRGTEAVLVTNALPAAEAAEIASRLGFDVLQLHGGYGATDFATALARFPRVWRATSLAEFPDLAHGDFGEERLLVDGARPGSGKVWDLDLVSGVRLGSDWLLAGGLSPANVADTVRRAKPAGVDVSSGVESSPGVKDPALVSAFISAARSANNVEG